MREFVAFGYRRRGPRVAPRPRALSQGVDEVFAYDRHFEEEGAVSAADARHVRSFRGIGDYADQCDGGLLLYDGTEMHWVERGVLAVPGHRVI